MKAFQMFNMRNDNVSDGATEWNTLQMWGTMWLISMCWMNWFTRYFNELSLKKNKGPSRAVFMVFVCVHMCVCTTSGKWDAEFTKLTSEKGLIGNPVQEENSLPIACCWVLLIFKIYMFCLILLKIIKLLSLRITRRIKIKLSWSFLWLLLPTPVSPLHVFTHIHLCLFFNYQVSSC